jgi:hypothetical protein
MKKSNLYEFKKIPTSDTDTLEENTTHIERHKEIDIFNIENKKRFKMLILIFVVIAIIWLLSQLYLILYEYDIIKVPSKLTIIINIFDKKYNISQLLRSLMNQSISFYEIIITKNFNSNYSIYAFQKFKKRSVKIKFLQYGQNDSNLKIRIDSAKNSSSEYILFIDPEEIFEDNILTKLTKRAIKEKTEIIQYDSFHDYIEFNKKITGLQVFDSMYFEYDNISQSQFHLSGMFINKTFFLDAVKGINDYYFENNNAPFEESMILLKLFRNANSFIKIKRKFRKKRCHNIECPYNLIKKGKYTKKQIKDILIYLKFLFEYTGNNVQEKRMSAKYFIDFLAKKTKPINNYDENLIKLVDEVVNLYANCEKISDYDINLIKQYQHNIKNVKAKKKNSKLR